MRTRHLIASGLAALALTAAGCGDDDNDKGKATASFNDQTAETQEAPAAPQGKPKVEVPAGAPPRKLVTKDLKEGTGETAKVGDQVTVNYVGVSYSNKQEFDASYGKQPFTFPLGGGEVIQGWDKGVAGMKVGGRRQLVIPPALGYGTAGSGPIKPNETLVFVVDLIDVQ